MTYTIEQLIEVEIGAFVNVGELPNSDLIMLVTDSQEVGHLFAEYTDLQSLEADHGIKPEEYNGLFVAVHDGEILFMFALSNSVPYLTCELVKVA